jgi:hypothetical protein
MRAAAVLAFVAALPFAAPAGFTNVLTHPIDYTESAFVVNPKTHEYVEAEASRSDVTQARLISAVQTLRRELPLPPQGGVFDKEVTICGACGIHSAFIVQDFKRRWAVERWSFVSAGMAYRVEYSRPSNRARNEAVAKKLGHFCPGDESHMEILALPGFVVTGPPRRYHIAGVWESRELGGQMHQLVYLTGTNLETDPYLNTYYLVRNGFEKRSSALISRCGGAQLQRESFTYGSPSDGFTIEREFGSILNVTHVVVYVRDTSLPASAAAEKALKSFCIARGLYSDFSGKWGGAGVALVIDKTGAAFIANCWSGAMLAPNPSLASADGRTFDLPGTLITGSAEREVRYFGSVRQRHMLLSVISLTGKLLARYDLKYGSPGDLHACGAGHRIARS